MKSQLLEAFNWATSWPWLLLIVAVIAYMIVMIVMRKKSEGKVAEVQNGLKVGDKVVTNSGIYGEIVSITETTVGRVAVIKSGEGKNVSYVTVHTSVIYGMDDKKEVVLDKDGNPVTDEPKAEPKVETKQESEPAQEEVAENTEEAKKPVAKTRKPRAKKDNK